MSTRENGIGFSDALTDLLLSACQKRLDATARPFVYCEIGVADGRTMANVCSFLQDSGKRWWAMGADKADGWSYDSGAIYKRMAALGINCNIGGLLSTLDGNVSILTCGSPRCFDRWLFDISLCLIDGRHCTAGVIDDFRAVHRFIPIGGFVAFHDVGRDCQGLDPQPCCGQPIQVDEAIAEMNGAGWLADYVEFAHSEESRGLHILERVSLNRGTQPPALLKGTERHPC